MVAAFPHILADISPKSYDGARIARALEYPYAIPEGSYRLTAAGWQALPSSPDPSAVKGRTAVIAAGSNAAPQQLQRKFPHQILGEGIVVTKAILDDYDSVYCAHFARYGAIPATLHPAPGVRTRIFITWLTPAQLARMHRSEALGVNYDYRELADAVLHDETGREITTPGAYIARHGALSLGGGPVPLAAVKGRSRIWQARDHKAVLSQMRTILAADKSLERFILDIIDDDALRAHYSAIMARTAHRFD